MGLDDYDSSRSEDILIGLYRDRPKEMIRYMLDACLSKWPNAVRLCPDSSLYAKYAFEIRLDPAITGGVIGIYRTLRIDAEFLFFAQYDYEYYGNRQLARQIYGWSDFEPLPGYTVERNWTLEIDPGEGFEVYWGAMERVLAQVRGDLGSVSIDARDPSVALRTLRIVLDKVHLDSLEHLSLSTNGYYHGPSPKGLMWTLEVFDNLCDLLLSKSVTPKSLAIRQPAAVLFRPKNYQAPAAAMSACDLAHIFTRLAEITSLKTLDLWLPWSNEVLAPMTDRPYRDAAVHPSFDNLTLTFTPATAPYLNLVHFVCLHLSPDADVMFDIPEIGHDDANDNFDYDHPSPRLEKINWKLLSRWSSPLIPEMTK